MSGSGLLNTVVAQLSGRVCSMLAGLVLLTISARCLQQVEFGELMFTLTFISLFTQLADFGTNAALGRLIVEHRERRAVFWGNFLRLRLQLSLTAMAIALAAALALGKPLTALLLLGIISIPVAGSRFFDPVYQVYGKPHLSTRTLALHSLTLLVLSAAIGSLGASNLALLAGYTLANAVYCASAWQASRTCLHPNWRSDAVMRRNIWAIALPIGLGAVFTIINSRCNILVIDHYRGAQDVGMFVAAARLQELAVAVAIMALGPLLPLLSRCADDPEQLRRAYGEILKWALLFVLPLICSAPLWAYGVLRLMYGNHYPGASQILVLLTGTACLAILCLLNSYVLLALGHVQFGYWLPGTAATLSLALNLTLVPTHGIVASAWIALLMEALMCTATFILLHIRLGLSINLRVGAGLLLATIASLAVMYGSWTPLSQLALAAGLVVYFLLVGASGLLSVDRRQLDILRQAQRDM